MKSSKHEGNFWLIHADLMTGLLFVFILLLAALNMNYVLNKRSLERANSQVNEQDYLLIKKDKLLSALQTELAELSAANAQLHERATADAAAISAQSEALSAQSATLDAKDLQIAALAAALNDRAVAIAGANEQIAALQGRFGRIKAEFAELKNSKAQLIKKLARSLDEQLLIDLNSGSVRLSESVLFDKNSFELKEAAKAELAGVLRGYFAAIERSGLLAQIDAIIIEGHTDSSGGYLYNLELSQKRSLEILRFIFALRPGQEVLAKLSAVGRGYMQVIKNPDGSENPAASRRIEIKLIFNNFAALNDYEKRINEINFD